MTAPRATDVRMPSSGDGARRSSGDGAPPRGRSGEDGAVGTERRTRAWASAGDAAGVGADRRLGRQLSPLARGIVRLALPVGPV
jgi:hypothetical protein